MIRRVGVSSCLAFLLLLAPASFAMAQDAGAPLSVGFLGDVQYFDPALAYDQVSIPIAHTLFNTLIGYDSGTKLVPELASSMPTVSDDGLTYTFSLRPDAQFVDHGNVVRAVTADDVVFSLNRLLRPDLTPTPSPVGPAFFAVIKGSADVLSGAAPVASGLEAVDPHTVKITLDHPDRTFLSALAMTFGSVIPKESGMDGTAFGAHPVGTGPYYLDSYTVGQKAVLKRNTHYWDVDPKAADSVEVRLLVPIETQFLQTSDGTLDIMGDQLSAADYPTAIADPNLKDRVVALPLVAVSYLSMDTSGPDSPFADVRVRQAVNMVIDKDEQIRIANGRGVAMDCILPPQMPGFDDTCHPYPYDIVAANALMTAAGNRGFATTLYTDDSKLSGDSAQAIADDLSQLGITVTVVQQEFSTLLGTIGKPHNAPMVYISWLQDFPDPADFIDPILSCAAAVEGGANNAWYCNKAVDEESAAARKVTDIAEAIPLYQKIQKDIMADAPWAPTIDQVWAVLHSSRIPSFQLHPVWNVDLRDVPIEQ